MRLVSFVGGYGRLEGADGTYVVPMGEDLVAHLAGAPAEDREPVPVAELELLAPVPRPAKIICVGLNYRDHALETGKPIPTEPVLFAKFANSVVGDGARVAIPEVTEEVDWEAELGVVVGRVASRVTVEEALDHVAGYTCLNDLSARDLQRRGGQWTRGKAIDAFLPMGPVLVTADEVGAPDDLKVRCTVNDDVVQDSSTSQMVFGVAELVSTISQTITLEPGDVIATGTPPGVGMAMSPPRFLRPGDVVTVEIEGLGRLTTTMVGAAG
ncbi:fumarylacetoacetate hydrolase family protein [Nocardioides caldifontis]|uniref:fumarylacetoacetate hydrolase family protein n=1 Tax=Nocardioides caldifontis TaxID=2588938 RepID=UPI0011E017EA|nr:fumarylacetoacetate hydrolase family protein [Nocardioides caldifontis]